MEFKSYEDAQEHQLREWAEGRPWHNPWAPRAKAPAEGRENGECCPDFSCCYPQGIWSRERRYAFVAASDEERFGMLIEAITGMVKDHGGEVIGDGKTDA